VQQLLPTIGCALRILSQRVHRERSGLSGVRMPARVATRCHRLAVGPFMSCPVSAVIVSTDR
jgi:hypothetical protein